jgi:hypothetical protein
MLTLALTHQLASAAPAADACTPLEGRDLASVTRFRGVRRERERRNGGHGRSTRADEYDPHR